MVGDVRRSTSQPAGASGKRGDQSAHRNPKAANPSPRHERNTHPRQSTHLRTREVIHSRPSCPQPRSTTRNRHPHPVDWHRGWPPGSGGGCLGDHLGVIHSELCFRRSWAVVVFRGALSRPTVHVSKVPLATFTASECPLAASACPEGALCDVQCLERVLRGIGLSWGCPSRCSAMLKGPFLTLGAMKGPFGTLGVTKGPFGSIGRRPARELTNSNVQRPEGHPRGSGPDTVTIPRDSDESSQGQSRSWWIVVVGSLCGERRPGERVAARHGGGLGGLVRARRG